ncbi:MAG TPA: rhodanese-like domain-containing protein [Phycisphaerales bacterium]|nr:rhodanese-like domain-containing protein [Phycisphaerales bacterium]
MAFPDIIPAPGGPTARFRRPVLALLVAMAAGLGGCKTRVSDKSLEFVGIPEIRRLQASGNPRSVLLIDPRSHRDFAEAHIPGARSIQLSEVSGLKGDTDPELERFKNLVVYGDDPSTGSARGMAKRLLNAGYDSVYLFAGGLREWMAAGLPVEGDAAARPAPTAPEPATPTPPAGSIR